ncbi:MAG: sporulation protein YqfD [Lachnospiraceae bacterium]|nr:sporulation protein YqfD [Lachnospiraceae bacterium]
MVHRIFGWLGGTLEVCLTGISSERFINLCRNRGMVLWQIRSAKGKVFFCIRLKDFYRLRPIARKCRVRLLVVGRHGLPFILHSMRKRGSFWCGILAFCCLMVLYSTRIWGISVEGQSYHSKESIVKYLATIQVYGGMAAKDLRCSQIEEKLRKKYEDVGWANVEQKGSKLYVHVREVLLVEQKKKKKKRHLIAGDAGQVVSIVTRRGTAKVKAGKKVKKGAVLISGGVSIRGDGDELLERRYVQAEGDVVVRSKEEYSDSMNMRYEKTVYTGRSRTVYAISAGGKRFFFYNPRKHLESYEKYDIIRNSGLLCPFLAYFYPVRYDKKTLREIEKKDGVYTPSQAEEYLRERYDYYLEKKRAAGYVLKDSTVSFRKDQGNYRLSGTVQFEKKQDTYKAIKKKNKIFEKEKETDGSDGNNH